MVGIKSIANHLCTFSAIVLTPPRHCRTNVQLVVDMGRGCARAESQEFSDIELTQFIAFDQNSRLVTVTLRSADMQSPSICRYARHAPRRFMAKFATRGAHARSRSQLSASTFGLTVAERECENMYSHLHPQPSPCQHRRVDVALHVCSFFFFLSLSLSLSLPPGGNQTTA